MDKRYMVIIAAGMLALVGCAQSGSESGEKQGGGNIIQVAMPEVKNDHEFYLTEKGDGYFLLETGDGNFTQRWDYRFEDGNFRYSYTTTNNTPEAQYVERDAKPYLTVSINNTEESLPAVIPLYRGIAEVESGGTLESREEGVISLDHYKEKAENPEDGSKNVWNSKGDNEIWLTIGGSFEIFKSQSNDDAVRTYTYPSREGEADYRVCFTFDKKGRLKS